MREEELSEAIERYISGNMAADERRAFEQLRLQNSDVDQRVIEHQQFVGLLKQYGERVELENRLNAIHSEIDVHTLVEEATERPVWIVQLWRNHHSKISVAASIAIFAILGTLFVAGSLSSKSGYIELRREVDKLRTDIRGGKYRNVGQIAKPAVLSSEKYRGTGFAITGNGLIATNFHVIEKADSVYVQNAAGKSYRAKLVYSDPNSDVAILKITDTAFRNLGPVPYTFKKSESDLAESVFTYGFPQDSAHYDDGRITQQSGLNGDSIDYQISVPLNPGNSGGPLLDSRGNVVGVVKARLTQQQGVYFASKSSYLLAALDSLAQDSTIRKPILNSKNTLSGLTRSQQVKKLRNYVFLVKVYAKN